MESRIAIDWYTTYIPFYVIIGAISGSIGGILYGKLRRYMVRWRRKSSISI